MNEKKPPPQAVYLVTIKVAGNARRSKQFIRQLANMTEELYLNTLSLQEHGPDAFAYELNLSKWEALV